MLCSRILCWFKSTGNSPGRVSHYPFAAPLKKVLSPQCKMERCMLIFQAVAKFSRYWAQKMRVVLPRVSSFQSAQCYQHNAEELRAAGAMTSHLLISLHKVSVQINSSSNFYAWFGKWRKARVNKIKGGANQVHIQLNTQFKTGSKRGLARRRWKLSIPQPPISRAISAFPVSCSADERTQRDACWS